MPPWNAYPSAGHTQQCALPSKSHEEPGKRDTKPISLTPSSPLEPRQSKRPGIASRRGMSSMSLPSSDSTSGGQSASSTPPKLTASLPNSSSKPTSLSNPPGPPPGPYNDYLAELFGHVSEQSSGSPCRMVLRAHNMVRHYHYLGDMVMLHGDEWEPVERALMKGYKGDAMLVSATMAMFFERVRLAQRLIADPKVRPESDMVPLWWLVALLDTAITSPIPWCIARLFIEMVLILSRELFEIYRMDRRRVMKCFVRHEVRIRKWFRHKIDPEQDESSARAPKAPRVSVPRVVERQVVPWHAAIWPGPDDEDQPLQAPYPELE